MSIKHILTIRWKFLYTVGLQPAATFLYDANTMETTQLFNRQWGGPGQLGAIASWEKIKGVPLIVGFTRAARELADSDGCGPLSKKTEGSFKK
jgi:hypothetical protein